MVVSIYTGTGFVRINDSTKFYDTINFSFAHTLWTLPLLFYYHQIDHFYIFLTTLLALHIKYVTLTTHAQIFDIYLFQVIRDTPQNHKHFAIPSDKSLNQCCGWDV